MLLQGKEALNLMIRVLVNSKSTVSPLRIYGFVNSDLSNPSPQITLSFVSSELVLFTDIPLYEVDF